MSPTPFSFKSHGIGQNSVQFLSRPKKFRSQALALICDGSLKNIKNSNRSAANFINRSDVINGTIAFNKERGGEKNR